MTRTPYALYRISDIIIRNEHYWKLIHEEKVLCTETDTSNKPDMIRIDTLGLHGITLHKSTRRVQNTDE